MIKPQLLCWVKLGNPGHGLISGETFVRAQQLEIMVRMWILLHCFISEGILELCVPHTGVVAVTLDWRGGREDRAVPFALCKCFVILLLAWGKNSHSLLHNYILHLCSQLCSRWFGLCACINNPSPNVRGCACLVDKSSISWELVHLLCYFKGYLANIISPYSAHHIVFLCEYISTIRDLLPISTTLLQSLCSLSCSLALTDCNIINRHVLPHRTRLAHG